METWFYCRDMMAKSVAKRVFVAAAIFCVIIGCGQSTASSSLQAVPLVKGRLSVFAKMNRPASCLNRCLSETVLFGCGAIGIDSAVSVLNSVEDQSEVIRDLLKQGADVGGSVTRIGVQELMDGLASLPLFSAVLVHSTGHLFLVSGEVEINGRKHIQLFHGDDNGVLASRQEVLDGGFIEAWKLERGSEWNSISVGSGKLEIDTMFKSLGEVDTGRSSKTEFLLRNSGRVPLAILKVKTSCSCTSASDAAGMRLSAGDTYTLGVTVAPNNSSSQRQSIYLEVCNPRDESVRKVRLTVIAAQQESLPITPSKVNFGELLPGSTATREIRLREVDTIRFGVEKVDVGGLPVTSVVSATKDLGGLSTYRIDLQLRPEMSAPGKRIGLCTIFTDNHVYPRTSLPVEYEILPSVSVEPMNLTVGTIGVNQPYVQQFQVRSPLSKPLSIELAKQPAECEIRETRDGEALQLVVTTTLTRPGIWRDDIDLKVKTELGSQDVTIRCSGIAR
jgi:hypothetical protein